MREPIAEANILVPQDYLGSIITLCVERRGVQKENALCRKTNRANV